MGRVMKSLFYVNLRGKNYMLAGFSWILATELFVCAFHTNLCSRTPTVTYSLTGICVRFCLSKRPLVE